MNTLASCLWREEDAERAVRALAREAGLVDLGSERLDAAFDPRSNSPSAPSSSGGPHAQNSSAEVFEGRIESYALSLGVDVLPVQLTYYEALDGLARLAPALIRMPLPEAASTGATHGYLAVLRSKGRQLLVLTPTLTCVRLARDSVFDVWIRPLISEPAALVQTWLEQAEVPQRRWAKATAGLLKVFAAEDVVRGVWILRHDPGTKFGRVLRAEGCLPYVLAFGAAALLEVACATAGWGLLGQVTLERSASPSALWAWSLLLVTAVPLRVLATWSSAKLSVIFACALKKRTLCGALRLDPNAIRARGTGGLLAMASECEAIERAGLDGSLGAFLAAIQLAGATAVLAAGAGGLWHAGLLVAACCALGLYALRAHRRLSEWTARRFGLSTLFVEQLQGHRTRLVQGCPERWHEREDAELEAYAQASRVTDRSIDLLAVLPARGWLILGLAGLIPSIVQGSSPAAVALALLGVLQAQAAFATLSNSIRPMLTAAVAWRSVKPLFEAAAQKPKPAAVNMPLAHGTQLDGCPGGTLELSRVSFRYSSAGRYALRDCSVRIQKGERWLLEGSSGGGKSTLANVIAGVYAPTSGLVLLDGLDRATLGDRGWHARVASAPQFHENHLLSAPLSFNLLMGRNWPPEPSDLEAARRTCEALGLGPLLRRMPSGIHQIVGETGWQLSHGERSRVFLARALLQKASLLVLDETFGALDPDTLKSCMSQVRQRAPTLLVIAHP